MFASSSEGVMSLLSDGLPDISISIEDGLRLSELNGQLAEAEYRLAHMVSSNVDVIAVPIVLVVTAMTFLLIFRPSWRMWLRDFDRGKAKPLPYSRTSLKVPDEYENDPRGLVLKELRREYERLRRMWVLVTVGLCVGLFVLFFALCYVYTQASLEADVASYTAQIEAILDKYEVV